MVAFIGWLEILRKRETRQVDSTSLPQNLSAILRMNGLYTGSAMHSYLLRTRLSVDRESGRRWPILRIWIDAVWMHVRCSKSGIWPWRLQHSKTECSMRLCSMHIFFLLYPPARVFYDVYQIKQELRARLCVDRATMLLKRLPREHRASRTISAGNSGSVVFMAPVQTMNALSRMALPILRSGWRAGTVAERVSHPRAGLLTWHPWHPRAGRRQTHVSLVAHRRTHSPSSTLYSAGGAHVTIWLGQKQLRNDYPLFWLNYRHKSCIGLVLRRAVLFSAASQRFSARCFHQFRGKNVSTIHESLDLMGWAISCGVDCGLCAWNASRG